MCLIFISLNDHPTYKLIVAANRDEFYNRRTAAADYWKDHPNILGGRDLEANGTWMGITTSGKVSFLTNCRDPKNINPNAPSRGHLVSDYLESNTSAASYMQSVEKVGSQYNGFNLLVGTFEELFYFSNYRDGIERLEPGLHGLSNHLLDTPWPKVQRGKEKLNTLLKAKTISADTLFDFLFDDQRAADKDLPETGIGLERERALSSMFIKSPGYGSRCSTVLLASRAGHVLFAERVYDLQTFAFSLRTFEFEIGKSAK